MQTDTPDRVRVMIRIRIRIGVRIRVRVRWFVVPRAHKGGAACTAALRKEVEEWHLGCGWKGGCAAC